MKFGVYLGKKGRARPGPAEGGTQGGTHPAKGAVGKKAIGEMRDDIASFLKTSPRRQLQGKGRKNVEGLRRWRSRQVRKPSGGDFRHKRE